MMFMILALQQMQEINQADLPLLRKIVLALQRELRMLISQTEVFIMVIRKNETILLLVHDQILPEITPVQNVVRPEIEIIRVQEAEVIQTLLVTTITPEAIHQEIIQVQGAEAIHQEVIVAGTAQEVEAVGHQQDPEAEAEALQNQDLVAQKEAQDNLINS